MTEIAHKSRSLRESIVSLAAVQGAEYLIPFLALPYLLRVLGPAGYGKIAFAQAFCMYFVVFTEYGFNLTGTRLIAIHRQDKFALSRIFWEIQFIKSGFLVFSLLALALLTVTFGGLHDISTLMFVGLLPVAGNVMYPLWLLQGLERMREAAMLMIGARVCLLLGVFMLVKSPDDLMTAAALQFGATPLAGIASWILLNRWNQLHWIAPSRTGVIHSTREGWHTFLATAASTLYRSSNAVVLGLIAGPVSVAYYSLAEKLVKAVQEINRPISQAAYPRVSALAAHSWAAAAPLLRRVLLSIGGLSLMASVVLFVFADGIIHLVAGDGFERAAPALRVMAFVPFVGSLNSVLGIQTLLPLGYSSYFSRLVVLAGIFNLAAIVPLVHFLADRGAALSFFLSELLLLISMHVFLRRQGIRYFQNLS